MSTPDVSAAVEEQGKKLSVQRAIGVLNVAAKANMLDRGVPETDEDKIVEAERILELARQAWTLAQQAGPANVPMYPHIMEVLSEGEVFLGIGSPPGPASAPAQVPPPVAPPPPAPAAPGGMAAVFCGAEDPGRDGVTCDLQPDHAGPHHGYGQTWDSFLPPDAPPPPSPSMEPMPPGPVDLAQEAAEANVMAAQLAAMYATGQESTPGGDASFTADPPGVPAQPATPLPAPTPAPPPQAAPDRPSTDETWADTNGGQWFILRSDGGPHIEVRSLATGEETIVPVGFLVQRLAVASVSAPTQEASPSSSTPSSSSSSPPEPSPSATGGLVEEVPTTSPDTTPNEASGSVSSPASPSSPSPSQASVGSSGAEPPAAAAPAPAEDTEGDPQYAELVEGVERDFSPVAMPVPMDLEREPDAMPDDLTAVTEQMQRALHSQFNALAARARYLRGLEDAKARGCKRLRASYMKAAMRAARAELGHQVTVTEVTQLAEEDETVKKWTDRMTVHAERAEAYKAFFEMYSENVTVLSRDWTMRDQEQRGS